MFANSVLLFILTHILLLPYSNPQVYLIPVQKIDFRQKAVSTATAVIISKAPATKTLEAATRPGTKLDSPPDFEAINTFARMATVNILCTTKGQGLSPISGTGVIISPHGVILTNAHIGQYFLLRDFRQKDFIECVIRMGSPAYPKYQAELVYISPTWVKNNKTILKDQDPKGTGEDDFAFLRITGYIDKSNLPESFAYISPNIGEIINKGDQIVLVSYPAGFLGGISVLQNLNLTSAIASVQDLLTFKQNTVDLISVPGTVVSQKGASGGAVVDKQATLIGIITTSSEAEKTSARDLRAITLAYINRDLQSELGITLSQLLNADVADFATTFQNTTAPILTKLITDELNKNQ